MTQSVQDELASLIAAETQRPDPSSARADAVWEGVQARLGGAPPPASVPAASSGPGLFVVSAVVLGLVGAAGLGWALLSPSTAAFEPLPNPPPLAVAATKAPAPNLRAELAVAGEGDDAGAVAPTQTSAKSSGAKPRRETSPKENQGTVADELALIEKARTALAGGRAAAALTTLKTHRRGFPRGEFLEEAAALRVSALCKTGKAQAASKAAAKFKARWPRSVHAQRVSDCAD